VVAVLDLALLNGQADMAVSASFRTFALEQLGRDIRGVRGRSMFGGVGVYAGERFFALIDDDTLYFKVDDTTRPDFEARGMGPFRPGGAGGLGREGGRGRQQSESAAVPPAPPG